MKIIIPFCFAIILFNIIPTNCLNSWKDAKILKYENSIEKNGMYKYLFETSDGTNKEESGTIKKIPGKEDILAVKGSYSYYDDRGAKHSVNYIADELGFRVLNLPFYTPSFPTPPSRLTPSPTPFIPPSTTPYTTPYTPPSRAYTYTSRPREQVVTAGIDPAVLASLLGRT